MSVQDISLQDPEQRYFLPRNYISELSASTDSPTRFSLNSVILSFEIFHSYAEFGALAAVNIKIKVFWYVMVDETNVSKEPAAPILKVEIPYPSIRLHGVMP
jgi:hypothetical protein